MRFAGHSEYFHDAAIAIIEEDGTVVHASHSERYSGLKLDAIIHADQWRLIRADDHMSYYEDIELKTTLTGRKAMPVATPTQRASDRYYAPSTLCFDSSYLHHVSHCAGAFYTRPWESSDDTVCVSIDGSGEVNTTCIMDKDMNIIHEYIFPLSIGNFYSFTTTLLGYRKLRDEYIVMGLSSYAEPDQTYLESMERCWSDLSSYDYSNFEELYGNITDTPMSDRYIDWEREVRAYTKKIKPYANFSAAAGMAAAAQKFFEDRSLEVMREARKYGSKLVYSGGCAQNVVANSMIRDLFDDMHIAIAPNDAGSSLGCAARSWALHTGKDRLNWTPYLGNNIKKEINPKEVAQYIVDKKVCGIANGRAEFGPRALGNRSLIGDVRYDVKDTVNDIKRRQRFRPFAPAILSEYADDYFEGHMNECMQYTSVAKHEYDSVTHVDGTARVQLVTPDCESILRPVLEEYYELTGVPMLLNTSLNIKDYPMVNNEYDARHWERKYGVKVW